MDRAFVQVYIDGKVQPLQISYNHKKMGEDITKQVKNLRSKIDRAFLNKCAFENKDSITLYITLCVNDENIPFDITIKIKDRKEQEIKKDLLAEILKKTQDMAYRLSYELLMAADFVELDQI